MYYFAGHRIMYINTIDEVLKKTCGKMGEIPWVALESLFMVLVEPFELFLVPASTTQLVKKRATLDLSKNKST